jgi:hypothetical protein
VPCQSVFLVPTVLLKPVLVSRRRDSGSSLGRSYSVLADRFSLSSREPRSTTRIFDFVLSPKGVSSRSAGQFRFKQLCSFRSEARFCFVRLDFPG